MSTQKAKTQPFFLGQNLIRHTSLNLIGQVAPVLVALISIPFLIQRLGTDRFGIMMLAWVSLGYFNLFDFGLGRALTKAIAERVGTENENEIPTLFWTTVLTTGLLGVVGGLTLFFASDLLVSDAFKVPAALESETHIAFIIIAFCVPFVITTASFRGVLEATENFLTINLIQVPISSLFYFTPLLFSFFSTSLPVVISALVLCRLASWALFFRASFKALPQIRSGVQVRPTVLSELLKFGGWVTVTGVLAPMIMYADRLIIGAVVSVTAVTYYATPYEIVNRMWMIPWAMMSVIFPAFASQIRLAPDKAALTFIRAVKLLYALLFPLTLLVILFSYEGLWIWVGRDLADKSANIMQILAIAVFINCFSIIPGAFLDASGRPSVSAVSHIIQLPLYVGALVLLVPKVGIKGAATLWVFRVFIDTGILFLFSSRLLPTAIFNWRKFAAVLFVSIVLVGVFGVLNWSLGVKIIFAVIFAIFYLPWIWFYVLTGGERKHLLKFIFAPFKPKRRLGAFSSPRKKVGIAMAVYQPNLNYLVEQLRSIREQTYKDWICVVSLDSEIDFSVPDLQPYLNDNRFIWVRNPREPGVKSNFENAISELLLRQVDMIAFSDQDDVWYPNKIERLVYELRKCPPYSLVHSNMHLFHRDHELQTPERLECGWEVEKRVVEGYLPIHFLCRNTVTGAACLFDVELAQLGRSIPEAADFHDHWFALLASAMGEVKAVYEPLYAYRQHNSNVVGVKRIDGFFYWPRDKTLREWFLMAKEKWERTVEIFQSLVETLPNGSLPEIYWRVFSSRLAGGLFFLSISFLCVPDDPVLARTFLRNGVGKFLAE